MPDRMFGMNVGAARFRNRGRRGYTLNGEGGDRTITS